MPWLPGAALAAGGTAQAALPRLVHGCLALWAVYSRHRARLPQFGLSVLNDGQSEFNGAGPAAGMCIVATTVSHASVRNLASLRIPARITAAQAADKNSSYLPDQFNQSTNIAVAQTKRTRVRVRVRRQRPSVLQVANTSAHVPSFPTILPVGKRSRMLHQQHQPTQQQSHGDVSTDNDSLADARSDH